MNKNSEIIIMLYSSPSLYQRGLKSLEIVWVVSEFKWVSLNVTLASYILLLMSKFQKNRL